MEELSADVYELLEISPTANSQAIKKAYRKKALKCHPDKNPDNPQAAVLFLELSKALELLLDESKRANYDKIYNAKKAAKVRHQELDSRRKKLKEDLEAREERARVINNCGKAKTNQQKLAEQIERLRKEGSKQLVEELESIRQQIRNEQLLKSNNVTLDEGSKYKIKLKWKTTKSDKTNAGYNTESLSKIFSKYGDIAALIVSQKKNGSALLEFESSEAALKAFQLEKGFPDDPLELKWLNDETYKMTQGCGTKISEVSSNVPLFKQNFVQTGGENHSKPVESNKHTVNLTSDPNSDFEAFVFAKLRKAQEKKMNRDNEIS